MEGLLDGVPDLEGDFFAGDFFAGLLEREGEAARIVKAAAFAVGVLVRPAPMRSKEVGTRWLGRSGPGGGPLGFLAGVLLRPREAFFALALGGFEACLAADVAAASFHCDEESRSEMGFGDGPGRDTSVAEHGGQNLARGLEVEHEHSHLLGAAPVHPVLGEQGTVQEDSERIRSDDVQVEADLHDGRSDADEGACDVKGSALGGERPERNYLVIGNLSPKACIMIVKTDPAPVCPFLWLSQNCEPRVKTTIG